MASTAPPWLADLEDDWVQPSQVTTIPIYTEATKHYDVSSVKSRIPRRSSGALSIASDDRAADPTKSGSLQRSILQELTHSAENSIRDGRRTNDKAVSRSVSGASAGSVMRYDTVDRRAKSTSPAKKNATLEWRKRLIEGETGYGDQTDLFGPTGLENMFQSPSRPSSSPAKPQNKLSRMFQQTDVMPSSPPPWPTSVDNSMQSVDEEKSEELPRVPETVEEETDDYRDLLDDLLEEESDQSCEDDETCRSVHKKPSLDSVKHSTNVPAIRNRIFSGLTDTGSSDFSPVFISKHTTLNGDVNYAPMDSQTAKMLQVERSESLPGSTATIRDLDADRDHIPEIAEQPCEDEPSFMGDNAPSVPEVSLPDNLPTGTPPITRLGSFVNTKRGGLSDCGSFKTRPLSPSPSESRVTSVAFRPLPKSPLANIIPTQMNDEANEQTRAQSPQPAAPTTPTTKNQSDLLSPSKTRSSGSPLKIFGNYDTFTNKKLLRRLSQLEDLDEVEALGGQRQDEGRHLSAIDQSLDEYEGEHGSAPPASTHAASKLSSFGEGELDEFDFEADLSFPSGEDDLLDRCSLDGSPPPDILPPGSKTPFRFHLDEAVESEEVGRTKRKFSNHSTLRSEKARPQPSVPGPEDDVKVTTDDDSTIDGKRPRSSPVKAPTPKRRRTLHILELEQEIFAQSMGNTTQGFGSIRPRNPTPNQERIPLQAEIEDATNEFMLSSPRLHALQDRLDESEMPGSFNLAAQAKAVASEVAAFTLNRTKNMSDGDRKRSITTQDFLDEAMHIMSLIRARGRPQSGLGNVEESDEDRAYGKYLHAEDIGRSSSVLRISRPPSREGVETYWRPRSQPSHDARVVSQLKRFEEQEDLDLVEATLESLRIRDRVSPQFESEIVGVHPEVDIRITEPRSFTKDQQDDGEESGGEQVDSFKTNPSVDFSTGRTVGTNSSRKSDNVATLAPESVAHLIPEEVAGMTFDRSQGKWVRMKGMKKENRQRVLSPVAQSNITSDDDPFGNIPDLTVNEQEEQLQVRSSQTSYTGSPQKRDSQRAEFTNGHARTESQETFSSRPTTRDTNGMYALTSSAGPSKYPIFTSSQQVPETRATSWNSEHLASKTQWGHTRESSGVNSRSDPFDLAGDSEDAPFVHHYTEPELSNIQESFGMDDSEVEEIPASLPRGMNSTYENRFATTQRHGSVRVNNFRRDLFSGLQDRSEMSILTELPDKRVMSVSVSVSRPPAVSAPTSQEMVVQHSSPEKSTFMLSDLPEFTVHEEDQMRPSEYHLAQRVAHHAMEAAADQYALAVQNIVKTLTDVEPDEPYWEDIKKLGLGGKTLGSIHGLDDFCTRVQELDVSNNSLSQLDGAPSSIRWLDASSNSLNSLTAWGHLMNLQYLDISNNQVESLDGLENLYHLRELRADNNNISLLYGVLDLDGLLKLSVRGNELTFVDFEQSQLSRLEELDLGKNHISKISNLSRLPSLNKLVLDGNLIQKLSLSSHSGAEHSKLRSVSLHGNLLESLDVSDCSSLRYLDLDQNRLQRIQGLDQLHNLETLSLRKQDLAGSRSSIVDSLLQQTLHCRSLYLSSNGISSMEMINHFHSVQHLEMASCGLSELPSDFGLRFPNLQSLNLNFNAIKDPRPLLNIHALEALHLAGNQMSRLRKSVATLAKLNKLRKLDIRDNPFTHGLYVSTATKAFESNAMTCRGMRPKYEKTVAEEQQEIRRQAYLLPDADSIADGEHLARLDDDNKLRRRVYELLLANSCKKLSNLDGLVFDRQRIMVKDDAFDRLVKLGIMKRSGSKDAMARLVEATRELELV